MAFSKRANFSYIMKIYFNYVSIKLTAFGKMPLKPFSIRSFQLARPFLYLTGVQQELQNAPAYRRCKIDKILPTAYSWPLTTELPKGGLHIWQSIHGEVCFVGRFAQVGLIEGHSCGDKLPQNYYLLVGFMILNLPYVH